MSADKTIPSKFSFPRRMRWSPGSQGIFHDKSFYCLAVIGFCDGDAAQKNARGAEMVKRWNAYPELNHLIVECLPYIEEAVALTPERKRQLPRKLLARLRKALRSTGDLK